MLTLYLLFVYIVYKLVFLQVNDPPVRNSQEAFMMEMRAARMVSAVLLILMLLNKHSHNDILFFLLEFYTQFVRVTVKTSLLVSTLPPIGTIDCV